MEKTIIPPVPKRLLVADNSTTLASCTVSIPYYGADTVAVAFNGLPGNQPMLYNNFVAIWEASMIPWTVPPIQKVPVTINNQSGSLVINDIIITKSSYIVGYGVGPDISNICCSSLIAAGGLMMPPSNVIINVDYIGTTSVSVHYQTLPGYLPKQYKNWIGLWQGYASPYNAGAMLGKAAIKNDASEGSVGINNVQIGINSNYTLIYFCGEALTTAAAILNFYTGNESAG
jgi:hypothetical protein